MQCSHGPLWSLHNAYLPDQSDNIGRIKVKVTLQSVCIGAMSLLATGLYKCGDRRGGRAQKVWIKCMTL